MKNFYEVLEKNYNEYICLKCKNFKCQVCDEKMLIEKSKFLIMESGTTPISKIKRSKKLNSFFNENKRIILIWCSKEALKRAFYIYPSQEFNLYVLNRIKKSLKKFWDFYDK